MMVLTFVFRALRFRAIVLVIVWSNVRLILLPFIAFLYRLIKYLALKLRRFLFVDCYVKYKTGIESVNAYVRQRLEVIVPAPIRAITSVILRGDNKVCF